MFEEDYNFSLKNLYIDTFMHESLENGLPLVEDFQQATHLENHTSW